jgi:HrpA-like RNA helicase
MVPPINTVFQAFVNSKRSSGWCSKHLLDPRALQRVYFIKQEIVKMVKRHQKDVSTCGADVSRICKCVLSVYQNHIAKLQPDGTYSSVKGKTGLWIHPSSVLHKSSPPWVVFQEGWNG